MKFSAAEFAKEEAQVVKGRLWTSMRKSMMRIRPSGASARDLKDDYRVTTEHSRDEFESLRSFSRDEASGWIPPASQE